MKTMLPSSLREMAQMGLSAQGNYQELLNRFDCSYIENLTGQEPVTVIDFIIEPKGLNLNAEETMEMLSGFSGWLKNFLTPLSENKILLNVDLKH